MEPLNSSKLPFDPIAEAASNWRKRWAGADVMATATALIRAQRIVLTAVESALGPLGLTFASYEALVLLTFSRTGRLPLGKMGIRLQVHPTSVTNTIDRLEADGLVRRVSSETDRRMTLAEITPNGRRMVETATGALNPSRFGLGSLTASDLNAVDRVLLKLRRGAGDF